MATADGLSATAAVTHDGAAMRERKEERRPEDGERQRHREFEGVTASGKGAVAA